jgi:tripartite ATP-independent transporter DctP family solute receptor
MHLIRSITSALVLAALLIACEQTQEGAEAEGQKTQDWKFAIEEIQGSVQDAYAQKFKELIEQRSNGRIEVTVYPYGTLGTSAQITELAQSGSIQFAMASPGHLGSVIPEVQLFLLHFVFSDDERVNKEVLADSEALRNRLTEVYRAKALQYLGAFTEGWMVWTANKPLMTPADFDGLKIRTMVSPLLLEIYELYGANPTPMAYSEVYSGLQLNMIDAQVNPVFAIEEMGFFEVQDAMTFANQLPFIATVVANPAFFDALPEADRRLVGEVTAELDDHVFDVQRELNASRLQSILERNKDMQVVRLSEDQRAAFREASLPIRDKYVELAGESGRALLRTLLTEIERVSSQSVDAADED